ncbi:MAG: peptidoglycan-binding protein [Acidobacteria bacterium]|nr:peptidoglycan-binding protein [Acidobacteriota bacterium]
MSYGDKKLEGGHAGSHNAPEDLAFHVAPATGKEKNTFRIELVPVACWRLDDVRFDFDSSFVVPQAKPEFIELDELNKSHPNSPYSLFGHADPVGDDNYNKILSGRRARAIYGILVRDTAIWEKLYSDTNGTNDKWGLRQLQLMLESAGFPPGNSSGSATSASTQAIRDFQSANGLTADGSAGPKTREKLFAAYFVFLSGPKLTPANFLSQGADPDGKGDYQGCSEFNPVMMFSAAENAKLQSNKTERNKENAVNRRVLALLFRPGTVVPPARWPCPKWNEGIAGCKKRFFANAATRRQFQAKRRTVEVDKDTFACRFYERLLQTSPCEGPNPTPIILEDVDPIILSDRADFEPVILEGDEPQAEAAPKAASAGEGRAGSASALAPSPAGEKAVKGKDDKKTDPSINANHVVVFMPRVYTAPDPINLTLKTTADFDGEGLFTRKGDKIKFTVKGTAAALTFNGTDNKFKGADLSKGIIIVADAVKPSDKMGDVEVTLTLNGGTKKNGKPVTTKLTSLQATLDICEPRINDATAPVVLPTVNAKPAAGVKPTDKIFLGRPLPVQSDPKIEERAMLIAKDLKPADFKGSLELQLEDDEVELYEKEKPAKGDKPLKAPFGFNAAKIEGGKELKLFVEGHKASTTKISSGVRLGLPGVKGAIDRVNITVCHTEIVSKLKPADVKTVDKVPEKPERKTKSTFLTAPIIMGKDYEVEMQPFIELAVPSAFKWTTPSDKITLTNDTTNMVKVKGAKLSAKLDDVDLDLLLTTDIGKLKKRHHMTVVHVEIDPVTSGDNVKHTDPINFIKNPSGCVILTGGDAKDTKLVPRYEITKIQPDLKWTDDDDRIAWWIIGGEAKADNKYDGKAAFMDDEKAKRGTKVQVVGGTLGDILIQPYSGGYGYGMIRAHVIPIKKVKFRINRIFTKAQAAKAAVAALPAFPAQAAQPAFPGSGAIAAQPAVAAHAAVVARPAQPAVPARAAHAPTVGHAEAVIHMKIANIFLRQLGVTMIPDDSAEIARPVIAANPGFAADAAQPAIAAQPATPAVGAVAAQPAVPARPAIAARPAIPAVAASAANNRIGQPALDNKVVTVTLVQQGHFDVEVNDVNLTFNSSPDQIPAIRINARNEVINVAYIEQDPTFGGGTVTLSTALLCPANHAPKTKARQPEAAPSQRNPPGGPKDYSQANYTLEDLSTPSSSLIPKTGIPPDVPAAKVKMFVLFPDVEWQPNSPANRDVDLLWGIVVPTRNMDSAPKAPKTLDKTRHMYGFVFAHEMGHILGLGHRGDTTNGVTDGLALPADKNIMRPIVKPPDTENFDIIQTKAVRFSELMARNP